MAGMASVPKKSRRSAVGQLTSSRLAPILAGAGGASKTTFAVRERRRSGTQEATPICNGREGSAIFRLSEWLSCHRRGNKRRSRLRSPRESARYLSARS